ncbi:MAG TPA: hypothetical protein DE315_01475 [Candidatus Omnitrophica bacterium]|nr:MAG: hypothetical protein A2Y05_03875 [Omnitrophica WOR_2 bacterium GWA2_53_43]HBO97827.1 hypothetical protein [Candidatus Omnitrophota bacterium]HCI44190.1 hypothetical protein [Candidatus Omnitrophota bacterium]
MVKPMIKERRGYSRAKRILSIEYRLYKSRRRPADQQWHLSTTEDIGPESLSFYSDYEYHQGDILDVRVVMSGVLDVFNGRGEVIRVDQKRMGACFFVAVRLIGQAAHPRSRGVQRGFCVPARHRSPGTRARGDR